MAGKSLFSYTSSILTFPKLNKNDLLIGRSHILLLWGACRSHPSELGRIAHTAGCSQFKRSLNVVNLQICYSSLAKGYPRAEGPFILTYCHPCQMFFSKWVLVVFALPLLLLWPTLWRSCIIFNNIQPPSYQNNMPCHISQPKLTWLNQGGWWETVPAT